MASQSHSHVIDGKTYVYPNNACPLCQPSAQQTQTSGKQPKAYTKGNTVVLKFSGASLITVTYWSEGKCYLMTMSTIARDAKGNLLRDEHNNPIWGKTTRRVSGQVLKDYVYELSALVKNIEGGTNVPKRD